MKADLTPLYFIGPKQIISSLDSNKVLDIKGASCYKGAILQLFSNHKGLNQKFFIEKVGYSEFIIRAAHSNLVLGVEQDEVDFSDKPTYPDQRVIQLYQNNKNNQKWIFEDAQNGYFYIRSTLGWYLHVEDGKAEDSNPINIHPFNGSKAQLFRIE